MVARSIGDRRAQARPLFQYGGAQFGMADAVLRDFLRDGFSFGFGIYYFDVLVVILGVKNDLSNVVQ